MEINLLKKLVYLDRDFVSALYEIIEGHSPSTTITRNEGKKAGAQIPFFSAEISSIETRTFPISTMGMLNKVVLALDKEQTIELSSLVSGMPSIFGWITGEFSSAKSETSSFDKTNRDYQIKASQVHFRIRSLNAVNLSLITTPEYFSSGLDALLKMHDTILKELSIPVRAYVRIIAANTHFADWVAVPLLILETNQSC